jgi:hypothetical protein
VRGSNPTTPTVPTAPAPVRAIPTTVMSQDGTVQNPTGTVQVNPETRPAPARTTGAGVVGTSSIGMLLILAGGLWWLLSR